MVAARYGKILLLTTGHLITDISQGAVPALLPFLIAEFHLSYAAAGWLIVALTLSSSVFQPVFGFMADRVSYPWFISLGPLIAAAGFAFSGYADNFPSLLASFFVCGLGIAAFHPEAAMMISRISGEKRASAMSVFQIGGYAGYALGPVLITALVLHFGLRGAGFFFMIGSAMAMVLWFGSPKPESIRGMDTGDEPPAGCRDQPPDQWLPFSLLTGAIVCRSIAFTGLNIFIPLYWIDGFGQSASSASLALTLFFCCGLIGTLFGGGLADRFGCHKTVFFGLMLLLPLLMLLSSHQSLLMATVVLGMTGFIISISVSPMVIMGLLYLPRRMGFASGITMGFSVGIGGMASPFLGMAADRFGIQAVFQILVFFITVAVFLFLFLMKKPIFPASAAVGKQGCQVAVEIQDCQKIEMKEKESG